MTTIFSHERHFFRVLCLALAAGLTVVFQGCGSKEEEPPPAETVTPPPPAAPKVEESAIPPTAPPSVAMGDVIPTTLSVLQYLPENAQAAIALPPARGLEQDILPFARIGAPEEEVNEALGEFYHDLGENLGVEAKDLKGLAGAIGVDPDSPIAVFFDFSPLVTSAVAAQAEAAEPPAETPPAEDPNALPEGLEGMAPQIDPEDLDKPAWVAVAGVTDVAKATAALQRIAEDNETIREAAPATEEVDGITLNTRGGFGYFTTGNRIAFGALDLLRGAAARVKTPATLRYGTVECPAAEPDEAALLIYGGRLLPLMESVLPVLGASPDQAALATAQFSMYEKMFTGDDDDPIVCTLARADDRVEFLIRVDSATHPGMMDITGPASPLRLAAFLPESTQAMLSFRFNDAFKAQLTEDVVPAIQAAGDPDLAMQVAMAAQFVAQLGDEATIGIAGPEGGLPELYVLLGLTQPEATQGVLQMFMQSESAGDEGGTPISRIDTPIQLPVFLSFLKDFAVASTSEEGIRSIIKRSNGGDASQFFASLDPPFDNTVPRYQATIIQSEIVKTALGAVAMFSPGSAADAGELAPLLAAVREIRTGKRLSGTWLNGDITVYLGDLEAAAAAAAASRAQTSGGMPAQEGVSSAAEAPAAQ